MNQKRKGRCRRYINLTAVSLAVSLLFALIGWWVAFEYIWPEEYASFMRPDGNYRVVVVRIPKWPALMPGQAGDAPGKVRLYDSEGRVLHETKVEMVQLVDHVDWMDRRVRIKLVGEWELPD